MIFVVLGTQKFSLNRLLEEIDRLIESGELQDEVFAQIGNSTYKPNNYKYEEFMSKNDFEKMVENSDLLICHSGVGTIISAITKNKPVIVYPRLAKYKEHVDDHQLQIALAFSEQKFVLLCEEHDSLIEKIDLCPKTIFSRYVSQRNNVIDAVKNFLMDC